MGIIRRIKKIITGRNPINGTVDNMGSTDEVHNLSDFDGSLESMYCEEKINHHCGCFGSPGGRCSECGVISCVRCHQHCGGTDNPSPIGCGKPICREHSHYLMLADGQSLPFCKGCFSKITRKERRQIAARLLLSPFVEQEDKQ
ncbi:MAG: hypothetical protein KAS23_12280 [Anaerohalosphaera sp.]|nr:hypothetical protein [Anaerohalosphaera sp.]